MGAASVSAAGSIALNEYAGAAAELSQALHDGLRWFCPQGTTQGFINCVYVHDSDYTQDVVRKYLFLLFWMLQHVWIACFPAVLAYAMMPQAFKRLDKIIVIIVFLVVFLTTVIPCIQFGQPLDANFFYGIIGTAGDHVLHTTAC